MVPDRGRNAGEVQVYIFQYPIHLRLYTVKKTEFDNIWNYYLCLEEDMRATSRFVEPLGQESVYSFEFAKIIVLASTESEAVMKKLCKTISGRETGTIAEYKEIILGQYPKIVEAKVTIHRSNWEFCPLSEWSCARLEWWDSYQSLKHSREAHFKDATYKNACYALSALYILIFYLAEANSIKFESHESKYITSEYCNVYFLARGNKILPGVQ